MTNKTTVEVWLVGAMYFDREALCDLDTKFRNTEEYRERLRALARVCKVPLSSLNIAIGIAAEDEAAISFLKSVDIYKLSEGFLVIGSLANFWRDVKRKPKLEVSLEIRRILGIFPWSTSPG